MSLSFCSTVRLMGSTSFFCSTPSSHSIIDVAGLLVLFSVRIISNRLAGESPSWIVPVSFTFDGETTTVATEPIANEQGHFETEWTIADGAGSPLTCAQAGATSGRFITTLANTTQGDAFLFDCEAGYGLSDPLDQGLYTVVVELLDSSDLVLNDNSDPFEETIIGNYIIHLGIFDFTITP